MKKFVLGIIALACISAQAEYTPEGKTIKVVLPQGPSSGMAMFYRHIENYAAKNKINMVPVFKPGAESKIGLQYFVAAQDKTGDTFTRRGRESRRITCHVYCWIQYPKFPLYCQE